jgi:DNA-directed RNA polymerase alpha subunit
MRKWEYLECRDGRFWYDLDLEESKYSYKSITEAGLNGWELVQFVPENDEGVVCYFFKREIEDRPTSATSISREDGIADLWLSVGAYNTLKRSSINTVGHLLNLPLDEVANLKQMTPKRFDEIKSRLKAKGCLKYCTPDHWLNS